MVYAGTPKKTTRPRRAIRRASGPTAIAYAFPFEPPIILGMSTNSQDDASHFRTTAS